MSITTLPAPPGNIDRITYDYLFRLTKQLNIALSSMPERLQTSGALGKAVSEETKKSAQEGITALKSLIIKSADTARAEIMMLQNTLKSSYVASSDYGEFQEEINAQITETAANLDRVISYYAELNDALGGVSSEFSQYVIETEGYIRQGIIGYRNAIPVIGIAIGQDIRVTGDTETVDGQEYDVIDTSSNMSTWTPERLSFYVNGEEIAYFSNGALYAGNIIVNGKLFLSNNKWEVSHTSGFTIKWIGG